MGSGKKRKKSDSPFIRLPKLLIGATPEATQWEIADVCIPSFDVQLGEGHFNREGMRAFLIPTTESHLIQVANAIVGVLSSKLSRMVAKCNSLGVYYEGLVHSDQKGGVYARFIRCAK